MTSSEQLSSFNVSKFGLSFLLVSSSLDKTRVFWPDFIIFVAVPETCLDSPVDFILSAIHEKPSRFLLFTDEYILHQFSSCLLQSIVSLLSSRLMGEKILFVWNPMEHFSVIKKKFGFQDNVGGKIVLHHYFSLLCPMLGNYFFEGEEEGKHQCSGWGFHAEKNCYHFIKQITLAFNQKGMKCKALQVLQNPKSKVFMTKR
jgi:hypothetical protein